MQFFEFYFNPKLKDSIILDSFCYEPDNDRQKELGNLCVVGQITNAMPENQELFKELGNIIQENYYLNPNVSSKEGLKNALMEANTYLQDNLRSGNVNWLGNFDLAVISVNQLLLSFIKVGNIKILLSRNNDIYDISENLEYQNSQGGPGSLFANIALGKLSPNDKILILTGDIFDVFSKHKVIGQLTNLEDWNKKNLTAVLSQYQEQLKKTAGIALLVSLKADSAFAFKPRFNFKWPKINWPSFKKPAFVRQSADFGEARPEPKSEQKPEAKPEPKKEEQPPKLPTMPQVQLPQIPKLNIEAPKVDLLNQKTAIITLVSFLTIGLIVAGIQIYKQKNNPEPIQPVVVQEQTQPTTITTSTPEIKPLSPAFYSFTDFDPQRITLVNGSLFAFNTTQTFKRILIKDKKEETATSSYNVKLAIGGGTVITGITDKNKIIVYTIAKNSFISLTPQLPTSSDIIDFAIYTNNLYLLDSVNGQIYKYRDNKTTPWITKDKVAGAKSIAIDKNVWILTSDSQIKRYFEGVYKETLKIAVDPAIINATKIKTSNALANIFILEPEKNRLVAITKAGKLVKQYTDPAWTDLKDFALGDDGKVYILNGKDIYQLTK